MTVPQRIQLSRAKGWRKPEGAKSVARPTRWGNPFRVGDIVTHVAYRRLAGPDPIDRAKAVELFEAWAWPRFVLNANEDIVRYVDLARLELGGRDLCCWCPLDQPCHAESLLIMANYS